jgi:serine/threonine protein kinase
VTAPRLDPGQTIAGKYTVRALLGFGGAMATYDAANAAGQGVAVKLWSPAFAARQDMLTALQQTIASENALPPELVLPVVDFGIDPQLGAPFTVTEASAFPAVRGPLPVGDVISLLRGMAKALDAAHARGLAHGALKPANVFFGPVPQRAVRVGDFGVRLGRVMVPTPEGFALAAPWMAPEQLKEATDTPASDVFSAALVAFFAATGRSFWRSCQGPVPDGQAWQQEIAAPRTGASVRAREVGATLPPTLDAVMARALAANPAERFASVGELAEAFAAKGGGAAKLGMTMPLNASSPFAQMAAGLPGQPPAPSPLESTMAIDSPANMPQARIGPGGLPMIGEPDPDDEPQTLAAKSPLNEFAVAPGFAPAYPQAQAQAQAPAQAQAQGYAPAQAYANIDQTYPDASPPVSPVIDPIVTPKKKTGLIIGLVLGGLLLFGGSAAVAALLYFRAAAPAPVPTAASARATATASAAVATAATPTTAAPPTTGAPTETASSETAPAPDAAAAVAATEGDAGTAAEDNPAEIVITCTPECETLEIDGAKLDDLVDPVQLPAGQHTITAGKTSYISQTKKVTLKAGDKQTVTFLLFKPGPVAPAPPKPCPRFVQHCP